MPEGGSARDIIESVLERPSVFKSRQTLEPGYLPDRLPHREKQLAQLAVYFRGILVEPGLVSHRVLIVGPIGVGKTTLARKFAEEFVASARKRGLALRIVYINCHTLRTLYSLVLSMASQLGVPLPKRGYSHREVFELIHDQLEEKDEHAIVILDEFDYFIETSGNEAVYFLVRIYDEYPKYKKRIHYIFVMRDLRHTSMLNQATVNYLLRNVVTLTPYTVAQLYDILSYRAELAFHPGVVGDEVLRYIAELTGIDGHGEGNARQALQILALAGDFADEEGAGRVTIDHVRKAHAYVNPHAIRIQDLITEGGLTLHQLLLLLAIIRVLKAKETEPYARMGEVEQEYRAVCEEFGERPRGHTQVYEYIRDLKLKGVIDAKPSGKGMRGRTTLIGLSAAPLDILEQHVIEVIRKIKAGGSP